MSNAPINFPPIAFVKAKLLREAVYRAIYTDANAKLQAQAMLLGSVTYLSPGEAEASMSAAVT